MPVVMQMDAYQYGIEKQAYSPPNALMAVSASQIKYECRKKKEAPL